PRAVRPLVRKGCSFPGYAGCLACRLRLEYDVGVQLFFGLGHWMMLRSFRFSHFAANTLRADCHLSDQPAIIVPGLPCRCGITVFTCRFIWQHKHEPNAGNMNECVVPFIDKEKPCLIY